MLNKLERQAADVLKNELLLRSEQELREKLDKLDPAFMSQCLNNAISVSFEIQFLAGKNCPCFVYIKGRVLVKVSC